MTTWNSGIHDRRLKEQICEIGRRVYNKGFAAANDGNISIRVGENEVLCSPTMICKGFMKPEDICAVDLYGNQIAGTRKRTSEVLLHLAIMRARPDVKAVVHCHPPHATAFGVAREPIPQCVLPEVEVFLGEMPPEGMPSEGAIVSPIRDDGLIVGYLVAANGSARPIDPRERELLEMLAD